MRFFKKLLKCFKKNQKQEDSWDNVCEKVESWSSSSTDDKEDSFENSLPTVEIDNQFSVIDLKFYTRYEEYIEDVRREDPEKYEKFKMYFSFLDAHRRKQYEEDFEYTIGVLNKNFTHIYLLSYDDLLEYAENNLRDGGEYPHLNIRTGRSVVSCERDEHDVRQRMTHEITIFFGEAYSRLSG
ncbi:6157_t:CDS:2 [Dentiscutata erythropus]|uniref:6157_t:CDS:1 n=1 Tax=Dentiscutata erythropus TaxID=1348616 RepID=A0A9N9JAZ1_9GLOM|nr:6157_t:CDS:2 [Dentiscutata erythropus]